MRPLLLFGVLYVVFTQFVRLNEGVPYFPAVLLSGIVLYTFFSDATSLAVTSVVDRESLVRKIQFPRLVVPLSVVGTALFNLGAEPARRACVHPRYRREPTPGMAARDPAGSRADRLRGRHRVAPVGALSALSRPAADLGGRDPNPLLRLPDPVCDRGGARPDLPEADHAEPARCRGRRSSATRSSTPPRQAPRRPPAARHCCLCRPRSS